MAQQEVKTVEEILQEAFNTDDDFVLTLVKNFLQEVLELERDHQIGVGKYERASDARKGSRNGYKPRSLNTRLGKMNLRKPEIREFRFQTSLFEKYQRSEQALILTLQQMVVSGVSTNRIKKITRYLSPDMSFSKSTISRMMKELDPIIEAWRNMKLSEYYEYLYSDAVYLYIRENEKVSSRPVLISIGVDSTGHRKILGVDVSYREDEASWTNHFQGLKQRGLNSVGLSISDANKGLENSLSKEFGGVAHQRCMVHFMRNLFSLVPHKEKDRLSRSVKQIFNAPDRSMAIAIAEIIIDDYESRYPRVSRLLEQSLDDVLTFYDYPAHHWRKIRTTNLIEHLNSQIKRRTKVVNVFPDVDSCIRYVAAVLKEIDEEWQSGRKYMKLDCNEDEKRHRVVDKMFQSIDNIKTKRNVSKKALMDEKCFLQKN